MQVRDDGSLILATHNRTYPMATVAPLVPSPCQRWVISGHSTNFVRCPLDPRKRTSFSTVAMSASCQKRTLVILSKRQRYRLFECFDFARSADDAPSSDSP
jgi:hypothetical protein